MVISLCWIWSRCRALQVQVGAEDYIHVKIFEFLKHERKAPILVDVEPLNLKI